MMLLLLIIAFIIIIILGFGLYQKSTYKTCVSRRRLEGKTVIVTGGTSGIGLVTATDLAHRGASVIIACPYEDEGINARNQIVKETGNKDVVFKLLDLASLASVRKFAASIINTEERLDILINNAGVGGPVNVLTEDGINFIMQVNYYGTFLLTMLLLPILKKTGKPGEPSRILTTSSTLHMIGQVDIGIANQTKHSHFWNKFIVYSNSKIYLLYFANELSRRLKGTNVVINNVDPGSVGTRIFDSINVVFGAFCTVTCLILLKTPWLGAQTTLHAALDENAGKVSGAYFMNCELNRGVKRAYCDKRTKLVWEDSVTRVKLTKDELEQCLK